MPSEVFIIYARRIMKFRGTVKANESGSMLDYFDFNEDRDMIKLAESGRLR